jgi:hypothetical protein
MECGLMLTVAILVTVTLVATLIVFLGGNLGTVTQSSQSLLP